MKRLSEIIENEAYLKISNLTDVSDCNTALEIAEQLQRNYPTSKTLQKLISKLIIKRAKLTVKGL